MQKQNIIKLVIPGTIFAGFCYLLFLAINVIGTKEKKEQGFSRLQEITAYQNYQPVIINTEFIKSRYLLLACINTDCNHCDYMTELLCKNINRFTQCRVVFLAQGSEESLAVFSQKHQLGNFKDILLLHDKDREFQKKHNVSSTPYFLIYNKQGKNILTIEGETKIDNLLKPLK